MRGLQRKESEKSVLAMLSVEQPFKSSKFMSAVVSILPPTEVNKALGGIATVCSKIGESVLQRSNALMELKAS
jgi:hypothetical protein